ncbi:MAG: sulfite exporter TauE/SafE family protein [Aquificaceae bacterium]|nr:sulfite exporter TauE/SafE family protein [Aquificaceae bacterium]MCX8075608.1 sulfite exporter TauE/SafE family protein [Aquificaceae bacterium]
MIPFVVVSLAWFFQSVTGFGAGIFIIGVLSIFYDPKMVVVSSAIFNLFGTLLILYQNRKGKIEPYFLLSLILSSAPGIILGAYLLNRVDQKELRLTIGCFTVLLGLYDLAVSKGWLKVKLSKKTGLIAGFLGGFFAGLVGMGGPPPLVFLSQQIKDPYSVRLMLNVYFTFNIILRLLFYQSFDVVSLDWNYIALGLAGLLTGVSLGGLLFRKVDAELYRRSVPYAVIALGCLLLIASER